MAWVSILDAALTLLHLIFAVLLALILGLGTVIVYRLQFHQLASVPGPKLAVLSNIWHAWHARNGQMRQLATTLHAKYGPVVRVGPNEVWFDSKDAFKTIYGRNQH